jgi:hypothetical protein
MNQPGGFVHEFHATAFSAKKLRFLSLRRIFRSVRFAKNFSIAKPKVLNRKL